ncbi:MAG: glycosyltransferase family 4 protein, partial [Alphaproteobacteria bacterium]|nr:glycosyltransferase family 4 protein [Alphaproteobacteria bacterium]
PRGAVEARADDPPGLTILPIITGAGMDKYAFLRRVLDERSYGAALAKAVMDTAPDLFITCTTPNDVLDMLRTKLPRSLRMIWWLQDIYSVGIKSVLNRKLPFFGSVVGWVYRGKEKRFGRRADHIVSITPDFLPFLQRLGVPAQKVTVIENWAPVNEITPLPHDNDWKREQGLSGKTVILYSGTLGLKHNPALLSRTALHYQLQKRDDVVMVVATQGLGAEFLRGEVAARGVRNLKVLPWQPYERLPEVLSSADILTAIIEPDAGLFSVPSKILSCLCVGRPVVAAIPADNLAARTIRNARAGLVVEPGDETGFIARLDRLLADAALRDEMGANGRAYAEEHFDIATIAGRFLSLAGAEASASLQDS